MKDYQKKVDEWVTQHKIGYWKPFEIMTHITEEVGELAREVSHRFGPKVKKKSESKAELEDEIGDVIFALTCLANSLDLDIEKGMKNTLDKCYGRDNERWEKK